MSSTRLSKGIIARIFEGNFMFDKAQVLQVLFVSPPDPQGWYQLLVSDGQWSHLALLEPGLGGLVISRELNLRCIFKFKNYGISTNEKQIVFIHLTVLKSGTQVGRKIGNPQEFKVTKNIIQVTNPASDQPPVPLTKGAIADIFEGGTPEGPVIQMLRMTIHKRGQDNIYCAFISDGQWSVKDAMLNPFVLDGKTNIVELLQNLPTNCIIRINKFVLHKGSLLLIIDWTVLHSGAELGQIGDPQPYKVGQKNVAPSTQGAEPACQPVTTPAQHIRSNGAQLSTYWLKAFEKRGVYIMEAKHGANKHIYHNI